MFHFADLAGSRKFCLSRNNPNFTFFTDTPGPLGDPFLSRQPCLEFAILDRGIKLTSLTQDLPISIDGKPMQASVTFSEADVARHPIITLGRRLALCLHFAGPPSAPKPNLGLIGNSDAISAVRNSILSVADLHTPVLIRGETGTGKELTANAIVQAGTRSSKPFLAVNIGSLPRELAAAEIFGHEKGAFTGASQARKGYFREVDGGTLFLDEIGLATSDVQTALLRVLETGQVRGLGARTSTAVDVRILAATDSSTIDSAVAGGGFSQPLFHRLSSVPIRLPPVREHRQDIGLLFIHFLRQILTQTGDLEKLNTPPTAKRPWLSAQDLTAIAMASWPGNVRQLRNFATELAVANRGASVAHLTPALLSTLAHQLPPPSTPGPDQTSFPSEKSARPIVLTDHQTKHAKLVDALANHDFEPSRAARALRVSRSTIYDHLRKDPTLGLLSRVSDEDFRRQLHECNGDLHLFAKRLRVSYRAVQLRFNKS
jgi:two-component system nitrogen regulation response regulator GlnG